ncbi:MULTISPECIES: Rha family transcriptional regulator [unclassified Methylobacterium]|uniref:Rha family transcriptional regulator n=1 Tax=unclassified Methylobacterium TaxID=2615210 RepID=UPI0036FEABE6
MFQEVSAFDPRANRETRSFDMNRDGFSLLVMGYTGHKGLDFKRPIALSLCLSLGMIIKIYPSRVTTLNSLPQDAASRPPYNSRSFNKALRTEFQASLSVESMDVDALVLMMLELEAAGISVEPKAFGPRAARPVPLAPERPSASANASPSHARRGERAHPSSPWDRDGGTV